MRTLILSVIFLPTLIACKKEKQTPPAPPPAVSSLSFDYDGYINGTHSVSGNVPIPQGNTTIFHYRWALAKRFSDFGTSWILLSTNIPSTPTTSNQGVQMHIKDKGKGRYNLPSAFGLDFLTLPAHEMFDFSSVTIEVTALERTHISGTFSGTAQRILNNQPIRTINITNGKFELRFQE